MADPMSLRYIREVVVASGDVASAVRFHQEAFGLQMLEGGPSGDHAVLGVRGSSSGRLRLVAAGQVPPVGSADPPEQETAAVWDLGARLLGIYSHDLDATAGAIGAAGGVPRTPVTYSYGTASLSELVARGMDDVWWTVPLAVPGSHRPSPAFDADPGRLHSELHTVVLVVDDHDGAVAFFEAGGMTTAFDGSMAGAPFDQLVGMPPEAALRLAFMVGPDQEPARLEVMSFQGVTAKDRTRQPRGIQRLVFVADDPAGTCQALVDAGGEDLGPDMVRGPAGVEIQVVSS
jgi:hypothetical protein